MRATRAKWRAAEQQARALVREPFLDPQGQGSPYTYRYLNVARGTWERDPAQATPLPRTLAEALCVLGALFAHDCLAVDLRGEPFPRGA